MTTSLERPRAVLQTRNFLLELAGNLDLPHKIRADAHHLLRHFPEKQFLPGRLRVRLNPPIPLPGRFLAKRASCLQSVLSGLGTGHRPVSCFGRAAPR
jgi:hypothetical protein